MKIKLVFLVVLSLLNVQSVLVAQPSNEHCKRVDLERLKSAMETVLKKGIGIGPSYYPTFTANGIRYQTDIIINIIENEATLDREQSEEACLLFIDYNDWYEAFMSVNCTNEGPPKYVDKAREFKQNIVIDYNRNRVIKEINSGGNPDLAANIALYWDGKDKSFDYTDDKSKPPMEVINERVITYRLLKYKDDNLIVCDQIKGFKGRALKGFLWILGKASMIQYRTISEQYGPQYVLMETKKWFFTQEKNLTISRNGETEDGIRIEEEKQKQKLDRKIEIQYEHLCEDCLDYLLIPSAQLEECDCN